MDPRPRSAPRSLRSLALAPAALLVAGFAVATPAASSATRQPLAPRCVEDLGADVVRFGEDESLGGFMLGDGDRWIVVAHQTDGDACQVNGLATQLSDAGFRALSFDYPGQGSSFTAERNQDRAPSVLAAVDYARRGG